jgi:FkbM family methyltransferase
MDLTRTYRLNSWSQDGEDRILCEIFKSCPRGFYVDVGAHHPRRFSNTYSLYRTGWHGLNIEPDPGLSFAFRLFRPRDAFVSAAVAEIPNTGILFRFLDPALNTLDPETAHARRTEGWAIRDKIPVRITPLSTILGEHGVAHIDFLNIDVEGLDLQVLKSIDWQRHAPSVIAVEVRTDDVLDVGTTDVHAFLSQKGYSLAAKTLRTAIYRTNRLPGYSTP